MAIFGTATGAHHQKGLSYRKCSIPAPEAVLDYLKLFKRVEELSSKFTNIK